MSYHIFDYEVKFSFDGVNLNSIYQIPAVPWRQRIYDWKLFVDTYIDYFSAEDIKGIEVWWKGFNAYIEITTRPGKGPNMKITPGTYLYKPLPYTLAKQFYRPRYTIKNKNIAPGTDLRSTIHWEPNVITDKDGKATVSFFSADKPADYTVIMEGTDMNGNFGYKRQQIKVAFTAAGK